MTPAEYGAALAAKAPPLTREQIDAAARILVGCSLADVVPAPDAEAVRKINAILR